MFSKISVALAAAGIAGWAGLAAAGPITDNGANDSFDTAQMILAGAFTLDSDIRIEDEALVNISTTIPHVEIAGLGDDTVDFYRFTVGPGGSKAVLDIDCADNAALNGNITGCPNAGTSFDSILTLFTLASLGIGPGFASNDDVLAPIDTGSAERLLDLGGPNPIGLGLTRDSFIQTNLAAGDWVVRVTAFGSIDSEINAPYILNISLGPQDQDIPAPATLALFGLGLAGLGLVRRKKS